MHDADEIRAAVKDLQDRVEALEHPKGNKGHKSAEDETETPEKGTKHSK
jgi:hypothetical protein